MVDAAGLRGAAGPTARDVAAHYDRRYYDDLASRYLRRTRFARQRIRNVLGLTPPLEGRRVVDVGCGIGTFALEAAKRGATAVGVDPAPEAVRAALRVKTAEGAPPASFVRADAAALPLAEGCADVVIAADLTEHLDPATLRSVLAECARILRTDGTLVVYTPSPTHLFERLRSRGWLLDADPSHIGMRAATELVGEVERAGLRPVRVGYPPSHVPGWNVLESVLARRVPLLRRRIALVASKGQR